MNHTVLQRWEGVVEGGIKTAPPSKIFSFDSRETAYTCFH